MTTLRTLWATIRSPMVSKSTCLALTLAVSGAFAAACNPTSSRMRSLAEQGQIGQALEVYASYVRQRGAPSPDSLAEVATVVLRRAATSDNARERNAAFAALRSLSWRAREIYETIARRNDAMGDRAAAAIHDLDGRNGAGPARLTAALKSDDPERRVAGLVSLEGKHDVAGLVAALEDVSSDVRRAAAMRLARVGRGDDGAFRSLADHARRDPDDLVRSASISALGTMGERAGEVLVELLRDTSLSIRMSAVSAIATADPGRAPRWLGPLLGREPVPESIEAARVLASHDNAFAAGYILSALENSSASVRAQAAVAAASLGSAHWEALSPHIEDADLEVQLRVCAALVNKPAYKERALKALKQAITLPNPSLAVRALVVLAEAGDASAVEPLRGALGAEEPLIRRQAVIAWSYLAGSSGEVDPLAVRLQDDDASVRLLAASEILRITTR